MIRVALLGASLVGVPGAAIASAPGQGQSPDQIVLPPITFTLEDLEILPQGDFESVQLEGGILQEFQDRLGHPLLPTLKLDVLVPADKKVANVLVVVADPVTVNESVVPTPIQRTPALDGTYPEPVPPDPLIYNSPIPYPAFFGEVVTNGSMRGYRLGSVVVYPVQYIGALDQLILYRSLEVTVQFAPLSAEERAEMRVRDLARRRNTLEGREIDWLKSFVRNPDDYNRFYWPVAESEEQELMARTPFGGFIPTEFPSIDGPPVEYVIITDSLTVDGVNVGSQVVSELQALADWKTSKGTPAVVRTLTWIRDNYSGIDDAAKIRNFLINAFRLWGTDYVLLGGDLRIVPARRFSNNLGSALYPGDPPADVYYGGLDNDWDKDNDGVFGEAPSDVTASDPYWDIWVGRVPLDTKEEAEEFVRRTLTYARAPGQGLSQVKLTYYDRFMTMAGLTNNNTWNLPASSANGIFIGESIARYLEGQNIAAQRHYQDLNKADSCDYNETWEEIHEVHPHVPTQHWTTQMAIDSLNVGVGFVHHYEHSNPYSEGGATARGNCTNITGSGGSLGRENIDRLTNKPNWSVVFSTGSGVNAFDYESISENWLFNPSGGAVAYMGKTRSGGTRAGEVDTLVFHNIFDSEMPLGQALAKAIDSFGSSSVAVASAYDLLGDPELQAWTSRPDTLSVTVDPTTFTPGNQLITVTVKDAGTMEAISGARVAIKQTDRLYAFDLTDAYGKRTFDVQVSAPDTIFVVTTAVNYSPVRLAIPKSSSSVKQVVYESHTAADDSVGMANNNGVIDAGEVVKLNVTVKNIGSATAGGVTGKLYATGQLHFGGMQVSGNSSTKIWIGASNQHPYPQNLLVDNTFDYHGFDALDFRERPAAYDTLTYDGLFIWREKNLWKVVARGKQATSLIPTFFQCSGWITTRGGFSNTGASSLESADNDNVHFATEDSIYFYLKAPNGDPPDQDEFSFVAREINWLTVTDSTGTFGTLAANATAQDRFVLRMHDTIPDRHEPVFELAADSLGSAIGMSQFSLPVAAPALTYFRQIPEPEVQIPLCSPLPCPRQITATMRNNGSGVADTVRAKLVLTQGVATVLDSLILFGSLAPLSENTGGSTGMDVFRFSAVDTSSLRFRVDFTNRYPDGSTRTWSKANVDVVRPGAPTGVFVQPFQGRSETVTWMAPSGTTDLAGFSIHRRLSGQAAFTRVLTAPFDSTTRFQDVLLTADTTYVYKVASLDFSGNESALSAAFGNDTWLAVHSGWPKTIDAGTPSSPVAVDIDSSGTKEIFVTGNSVYAWHADGTPVIAANADGLFFRPQGTSLSVPGIGRFGSSPAIGDLDLDGNYEIVVSAWDDSIYVLNEQGNIKWKRYCVPKWSSPALGDIDGDDTLEVFVGSEFDTLYGWRHDGKPVIAANPTGAFSAFANRAQYGNYATPSFADIDNDSTTVEVIFATAQSQGGVGARVYAWDKDADSLWAFNTGLNRPLSTVAIGDVDDDGTLEVVVAQGYDGFSGNNKLYVLNATTGALETSWTSGTQIPGSLSTPGSQWIHPPSLADVDGDGKLEIVVGTSGTSSISDPAGRVLIFEKSLSTGSSSACVDSIPLPGLNQTTFSGNFTNSGVIVANLDYDPTFEIVAGSATFGMFMWELDQPDTTCRAELGWPMTIFGEVDGTPWVGDVDNDGTFEMVVKGLEQRVHLVDLHGPYAASKVEWGQFAHDLHHTSRYAANTGGSLAAQLPPDFQLVQNAPNPFNPVTSIHYTLGQGSHVTLAVYDVTGRLLRELVDARQAPGNYEVLWDGTDVRGQQLASGVYFCRLQAGGFIDTRKMLMLK